MICEHAGREFDARWMSVFPTGLPWMPHVFVHAERICFAEVRRASWNEPRMRYMPITEALRIADTYHIHELRALLGRLRQAQSAPLLETAA